LIFDIIRWAVAATILNVMLSLLLAGAFLAQSHTVLGLTNLQVGGFVLLTDIAFRGPNLPPLDVPVLTDARCRVVAGSTGR